MKDKPKAEPASTHFRVTWEIDLEMDPGTTHEEAAREALDSICRPGSIAHVFYVQQVTRPGGRPLRLRERIDLDEIDEQQREAGH